MLNKFKNMILLFVFSNASWGYQHHHISSLGVSPKGQYVALEEFGYWPNSKKGYVKIKIMNLWKDTEHPKKIDLEESVNSPADLEKLRLKAHQEIQDTLKQLDIIVKKTEEQPLSLNQ